MARYFDVHPSNPQPHSIAQVVDILDSGVIAYTTENGFALGTRLGNQEGVERIRTIRQVDSRHHMTIVVSNFAQFGRYVEMDNWVFRSLKAATPGSYTFILPATKEIPRMMQHPKKKTIGIRLPQHRATIALLEALGEPLISSSLILPGHEEPLSEGWIVEDEIGHMIDAIFDSGDAGTKATTVVDLSGEEAVIVRRGAGDPTIFES